MLKTQRDKVDIGSVTGRPQYVLARDTDLRVRRIWVSVPLSLSNRVIWAS